MKSRGSQCNETLLVRTALRPGKKLGLQSAAKKLAVWLCALKDKMPSVDNAVEFELTSASGEELGMFQAALQMFR